MKSSKAEFMHIDMANVVNCCVDLSRRQDVIAIPVRGCRLALQNNVCPYREDAYVDVMVRDTSHEVLDVQAPHGFQ